MPNLPITLVLRQATISPAVNVLWSDGVTPFTGRFLFGLQIPDLSGTMTPWPSFTANTNVTNLPLPGFTLWPIVNGVPSAALGLIYNADINPPTTQYVAWLVDSSGAYIIGPTAPFSVSGSYFTPPTLTPVLPTISNNPVPD